MTRAPAPRSPAPAPAPAPAYIYTRTSTGEQVLGHAAQEAECRALAARLGLNVTSVTSESVSGSVPPVERAGFGELLDALPRGAVVLVWRRDRLGRSTLHNAITERLLEQRGARLVSLEVSGEDTAEAALMRTMLDAMAEYERALVIRRTKAALSAKRARGEALGPAPLGERVEAGKLVEDAQERATLERVRAWRAEGGTIDALCERARGEGLVTRHGRSPSRATIARWCAGVSPAPAPAPAAPAAPASPAPAPRAPRAPRATLEDTRAGLSHAIRALHARGLSVRSIAGELALMGYTNSKGKPISYVQVHRVLNRL